MRPAVALCLVAALFVGDVDAMKPGDGAHPHKGSTGE